MSISTGTGDEGQSGLVDGSRVPKDHLRLQAYGTVDELNAILGVVLSHELPRTIASEIKQISHWLFTVGCKLASPPPFLQIE